MKYQLALGLLAVLCFLGVSCNEETSEQPAQEAAKVCEPGSVTEVKCNECVCSQDGTELACTKRLCPVEPGEGEVKPENLPAPETEEVKPQNLPAPEAEVPAVAKDRRRRRDVDEGTCEPGKNFKKDCNECVCPASGKRSEAHICTLIAC